MNDDNTAAAATVNNMDLKHDQVVVLHVVINTDQAPQALLKALLDGIRGVDKDATAAWLEVYRGPVAKDVWRGVQQVITKAVAKVEGAKR